ncbi:predicted protein [Botrytis cinerea T4]|uniref:Uncharacterized protein n=1 Tax=Botryotinia fuckeliana (strain T4) TaxID=999810 RepID=G2Y7R8_BOTF4|nr:predicted protein [Botrytis cinerea T4]
MAAVEFAVRDWDVSEVVYILITESYVQIYERQIVEQNTHFHKWKLSL